MEIVSLINMKGGVGKTTTTRNLAGAFAKGGSRVLCVDNDWQCNLGQGLLGHACVSLPPEATIAAVYEGEAQPGAVIRPTSVPGLDIVPGSMVAEKYNRPEPWSEPWPLQVAFREFFAELDGRYDVILIDCSPGRTLSSWSALVASTWAVVPVQPKHYSSEGISPMFEFLEAVRSGINPGLGLLGLAVTMMAKEAVSQLFETELRKAHGDLVFAANFPRAPVFEEADIHLLPVTHYKPRSAAAKATVAVADEIRSRMAAARPAAEQSQEAA